MHNSFKNTNIVIKLALSVCSLLIIIELIFRNFVAITDGFAFTLSHRLWNKKYWKPINSYKYRDVEHTERGLKDKNTIFVVGDSFVAGAGIKNYKNRFANVLKNKLGKQWEVVILSQPGWNSIQELKAIKSYPYKPDFIILSYLLNDIDGDAEKNGYKLSYLDRIPKRNRYIKPIVDNLYLFNFIYWRIVKKDMGNIYTNYLYKSFYNDRIWDGHKKTLSKLVYYAEEHNVKLIVLVWPFIQMFDLCKELTNKVVTFFQNFDVTVLALVPVFEGRNPKDMTVNSHDAHPNSQIHYEVGNILYNEIIIIEGLKHNVLK